MPRYAFLMIHGRTDSMSRRETWYATCHMQWGGWSFYGATMQKSSNQRDGLMRKVASGRKTPSNLQLSRLVKMHNIPKVTPAHHIWFWDFTELRLQQRYSFLNILLIMQAGPRICLGKDFAYRQMKIFSAVLLLCFIFKLKDDKKAVHYKTMINLFIDGGLHVCVFHRSDM